MDLKCLVYLFAVFNLSQSESDRIIAGELSKLTQFPYVVALWIPPRMEPKSKCTGSIIARKWVITAAHCYRFLELYGLNLTNTVTIIKAGTINYNVTTYETQTRQSVRYIVHDADPDRDIFDDANLDVALIEVDKPFIFNVFVNKITMAKFPSGQANLSCISVGFGRTTPTGPINNTHMFYINTIASDYIYCKKKRPDKTWTKEHLCVDPVKTGTATCSGDSGSPLVYEGFHIGVLYGRHETINISSGPSLCAAKGNFQVYEKVSFFEGWIRGHIPEIPPMKSLPMIGPRSGTENSATVVGVSVFTIASWLSILVVGDRTSA